MGQTWTPLTMGLEYLHEWNIVHGNLRGNSILVGRDGKAKLAEFGMSGSANWVDPASQCLGVTRWQASERLEGELASFDSDIYSFGLCIIQAITGKLRWDGDGDDDVERKKNSWNPCSNWDWREPAGLTEELRGLISHMCSCYPYNRAPAAAIVRMLERFAAKEAARYHDEDATSEPVATMATYRHGELTAQWDAIRDLTRTEDADDLHQQVLQGLEAVFARVQQSDQPVTIFKRFHDLLLEVQWVLKAGSLGNRVHRLSSTRATDDSARVFLRQITLLLGELDRSGSGKQTDEMRWNEHRSQEIELFVSDKSWWTLNDLKSDEDRLALVTFLMSEIELHGDKYSTKQREAMQQALADISDKSGLKLQVTTPQWFVPWYELIMNEHDHLGAGGFGTVFRAKWLDSEVVVKKLTVISGDDSAAAASFMSSDSTSQPTTSKAEDPKVKAAREEARKMFEHEVEIWFGLSHPHVVRLFGACHVGTPFFVCEYATNGSLDKFLRDHPKELWPKLHEATLGVLYLYERDITHGDLKCNNIVVGSDGKAKVTDFGLSSAQKDGIDGKVSGAWQWLAPECLEDGGSRLSPESDAYAFGMCVMEAMRVVEAKILNKSKTECPPYPWLLLDICAVKHHVMKGELLLRPSVVCSDAQWTLVERMCKREPEKRIKITTVVDELALLASGRLSKQAKSRVVVDADKHVSTVITEMKQAVDDGESVKDANDHQKLLRGVYQLMWERLDHVSGQLSSDLPACERLMLLVDRVRDGMTAVNTCFDLLIPITETALHAYVLHRQLDKFLAAKFLTAKGESGEVNDWKPRCEALMGVKPDAIRSTGAARLPAAA